MHKREARRGLIYRILAMALLGMLAMGQTPLPTEVSIFDAPLQLYKGPAEPYEVIVTVQPQRPKVGTVHFAVTVLDPGTQTLVEDARVLIVAYNPDGEPTYQSPALNDPATPIHYLGNIIFRDAGQWSLVVKIETAEHGETQAVTPIHIAPAASAPGFEGVFVLAVVAAALFGGTAYVAWSIRRSQRARDAARDTAQDASR